MVPARTCASLIVLALALAACRSEQQAQLVVVVHSDMAVPAELDAFRAHVSGPQGEATLNEVFPLGTRPGEVQLPTDFGVAPKGGDVRRRVTIAIDAIHAGATLFTTTAITTFLRGRRLRVDMFLAASCIDRARLCEPDETCRREGCVPPEIDPADLPEFEPGEVIDAGQAPLDAGRALDAGQALDAALDAATDAEPVLANPFVPADVWVGTYVCSQGETNLVITIDSVDALHVVAIAQFDHVASGTTGSYWLTGDYEPTTRHLYFDDGDWIVQPAGWVTSPIDGYVSEDGRIYSGTVVNGGCGGFSVALQ